MNVVNLKEIIQQQNPHWRDNFKFEKFVERGLVDDIKLNSKFIEIITGVRRGGKSVILKILIRKLIEKNEINAREILFLNLDYPHFVPLYENSSGLDTIVAQAEELTGNKIKYLFLDEIQNIQNWEKWIKAMYDEKIFKKIFVTGSNANLLNDKNITRLSGRYFVHVNTPFSFPEFLVARNQKFYDNDIENLEIKNKLLSEFDKYLKVGGFPEVILEKDPKILNTYYQTILQKDILSEIEAKNSLPLKELAYWLVTNHTSFFSYNKLSKFLGIDETTIAKYIELLKNSFLVFDLKKFDVSLKKQMRNQKKIYLIDNGLTQQIGFNFVENKGNYFENLIFLTLQKQQKEIFYHNDKKECDFILKQGLKITDAYQVCYTLNDKNRQREFDGLMDALEKYNLKEGIIITRQQEDVVVIDNKKIKIIPAWKWMLDNDNL
jgi:predicted AAA+ superfamily ATPase